jgi:hypothetical protein
MAATITTDLVDDIPVLVLAGEHDLSTPTPSTPSIVTRSRTTSRRWST